MFFTIIQLNHSTVYDIEHFISEGNSCYWMYIYNIYIYIYTYIYIYIYKNDKTISLPSIGQDDAPFPGSPSYKMSLFIGNPNI